MEKADLIIKNGIILTVDNNNTVYNKGSIAIKDNTIVEIGNEITYTSTNIIDAENGIIIPGFINTHTHATMTMFRGYADDKKLADWLQNYIWPAEAKFINKKNVQIASELAIAEMIHSGITTFNDMYFLADETAQIAKKIGIRAVLGEAKINLPVDISLAQKDEYIKIIERYKNDDLIVPSVIAHAPYTCSKELLIELKKIAKENNTIFHIHLSETKQEVEDMIEKYGLTPVEYLDKYNILDKNTLAVHVVHLSDNDINILKKHDVKVSINTKSNLKLTSGIAPLGKIQKAGITISLGTDGAASNNTLNILEEMSITSKLHKTMQNDPTAFDATTMLRFGTINGAKALGISKFTGSLEVGKKADIVIFSTKSIHITPVYDPYSALLNAAQKSDIETVIINGEIVMHNKKLTTIDEKLVINEMNLIRDKIIGEKL